MPIRKLRRLKVVAVVQARTGSTRLRNKVMLPLAGATLLERMVERVLAAESLDEVVVATTTEARDFAVRDLCEWRDFRHVGGDTMDLLDRHLLAGETCRADVVVKIPSDCPLIDPKVIDRVVHAYLDNADDYDYASNLHPASYPDGNNVEVIPMRTLQIAWQEATRLHEREHTTPFIWDQPERFRLLNVRWESGRDLSMSHRFTVDYKEDYEFVQAVYDELYDPTARPFSFEEIPALLERRPDIHRLNRHLAGMNWYRDHLHELRTIRPEDTVVLKTAI